MNENIIFLVIGGALWLFGGNLIISRHKKRIGKPKKPGFIGLRTFPFKTFEKKEWISLIGLLIISICIMSQGLK